jgi:hypothetical protein
MIDGKEFDLQIQVVLTTFRAELRDGQPGWEAPFRARAQEILDPLDARAVGHRDLQEALSAARDELGLVGTAA